MNTGNNLLYLLESMVLALIVVSGVLSEQSVRGVRLTPRLPDEIYAGTPCLVGAVVRNTKRRRPSYSITLERSSRRGGLGVRHAEGAPVCPEGAPVCPGGAPVCRGAPMSNGRLAYLARLGPGEDRLVTWEETLPRRGRHRLSGVRVVTRFPFGLFVKATRSTGAEEVLVYPRRVPPSSALLRQAGGLGSAPARRRGRGHDLHDLRAYHAGDDPRLIHWRVSARTGALTVRELEAETAQDAYLVLRGDGHGNAERLDAALADAAAVAAALLKRGARVGMVGPGIEIPLGQGAAHARRILTALALYEPGTQAAARAPEGARTVVVELD